jgi:hypothetical protein
MIARSRSRLLLGIAVLGAALAAAILLPSTTPRVFSCLQAKGSPFGGCPPLDHHYVWRLIIVVFGAVVGFLIAFGPPRWYGLIRSRRRATTAR